jgi:hypothetical protein
VPSSPEKDAFHSMRPSVIWVAGLSSSDRVYLSVADGLKWERLNIRQLKLAGIGLLVLEVLIGVVVIGSAGCRAG